MASTYLQNPASGSSVSAERKTLTLSAWVKRSKIGATQYLFTGRESSGSYYIGLLFNSSDQLRLIQSEGGSVQNDLKTNRVFRDTSAWYHIVCAIDTTQATSSDRVKFYVNGTQETSFATSTYFPQNHNTYFGMTNGGDGYPTYVGSDASSSHFDGIMAHVHLVGGTAYDGDTFGETDSTTGIWKPKTAPSITYGTGVAGNAFLKFENSGAFGTDSSGNGNNFTVNGTMTQTIDTPSNVFSTWNPLVHASTSAVFSNGNTKVVPQDNTSVNYTTSTLAVSSGKYYAEFKKLQNNNRLAVGIIDTDLQTGIFQANSYLKDVVGGGIIYDSINGKISGNNGDIQTGLTTAGNNDIIGLAVDMDNKLFYVYVNGTLINSGGSGASFSYLTGTYSSFWVGDVAGDGYDSCEANFGNGYFGTTAVASAQNPDDGIGIFEYSVPTGYKALCTKSINSQEYD